MTDPGRAVVVALELVPLTQRQARAFVVEHHRHNGADRGDILRVGLELDGGLVAVAQAGRPKAQALDDGRTIEVTRVCTLGTQNACSRLYGALCRAAKALGYQRAYTYTLASEAGVSPAAAGFVFDGEIPEREWVGRASSEYSTNLFGERVSPDGRRLRWRREL